MTKKVKNESRDQHRESRQRQSGERAEIFIQSRREEVPQKGDWQHQREHGEAFAYEFLGERTFSAKENEV